MTAAESDVGPRPPPSGADRRAHVRAHLRGPVLADDQTHWQRTRCENVSEGGVALECRTPLRAGRTVEIYFELPSGVAIETEALVLRSTKASAAVRFLSLDRASKIALRHHCRSSSHPATSAAR